MTDEEKEEINKLKEKYQTEFLDDYELRFIFNVIQTQQEEIERLECNNEILQGEIDRIGTKALKLEAGSSTDDVIAEIEKKDRLYHRALSDLVKSDRENIKKNKVIDLILEKQAGSSCLNIYCKKRNKKDKCLECVKEYFINKVEKENK